MLYFGSRTGDMSYLIPVLGSVIRTRETWYYYCQAQIAGETPHFVCRVIAAIQAAGMMIQPAEFV